jgi:hypothetical protein
MLGALLAYCGLMYLLIADFGWQRGHMEWLSPRDSAVAVTVGFCFVELLASVPVFLLALRSSRQCFRLDAQSQRRSGTPQW